MNYIAVRGKGNPNEENREVKKLNRLVIWNSLYYKDERLEET